MIKAIRKIGDKYSLYVYIFHVIIYRIISNIFSIVGLNQYSIIQWITPIIVVISSVLFSMILDRLIKMKKGIVSLK